MNTEANAKESTHHRNCRLRLGLVAAATLFFAILCGLRVFYDPLWGDEFRTWRDSVGKSYGLIFTWQHNRDHAPLGHLLAKLSCDLFRSTSPWALRLPSFLVGVLCIPAGYWLGRLAHSPIAGVALALLLAVDYNLTQQAQMARMYSLLMLLSLAAIALLIRLLDKRSWSQSLALGVTIAAALWTHAAAMALLMALPLVMAVDRRAWKQLLVAFVTATALGAPALFRLVSLGHKTPLAGAGWDDLDDSLITAFEEWAGPRWIAIATIPIVIAGLTILWKKQRGLAMFAGATLAFALANLLIATRFRSIGGVRVLTILEPSVFLAVAVLFGWCGSHRHRGVHILATITLLASVVFQAFRAVPDRQHPLARKVFAAQQRLRTLGCTASSSILYVPQAPWTISMPYYGFEQDRSLRQRFSEEGVDTQQPTTDRSRDTVWCLVAIAPAAKGQTARRTAREVLKTLCHDRSTPFDPDVLPAPDRDWQVAIIRVDASGAKAQ